MKFKKKAVLLFVGFISVLSSAAQNKYQEERVLFDVPDDTIRIGATLSYPEKGREKTAVVLVSGTGKQDRDADMRGQKLFARLADYFSTAGFLVLRMDDRGVGETNGVYEEATTEDFAKDALAAVAYLRKRSDLHIGKIGLLGHSEGGAAIAIAASRSGEVAFLISLAGLASNGLDALIQQNEDLVAQSKAEERDKVRSDEINNLMFATAYHYADSANLEEKLNERYNAWKKRDDAYFKTLGIEFDHFRFPIYSYVNHAITPWYRFFVRYNAQLVLSQVKVPVLALNGDKDAMVSPGNLNNWKDYIEVGGNKEVTTKLLPGVNHLFQVLDAENNPGPISEAIMADIVTWLYTVEKR